VDIEIGSNLYRNSDGTVEIEGVPQIQATLEPSTGALFVSFALFDANGRMRAKVVDSTMVFNDRRAYDYERTAKSVVIKDAVSGKVLFQLEVKAPNVISLPKGEFHTMKGHLFEVSEQEWKIGTQKVSGQAQDAQGKSVSIG
jgi:hypothetical protein